MDPRPLLSLLLAGCAVAPTVRAPAAAPPPAAAPIAQAPAPVVAPTPPTPIEPTPPTPAPPTPPTTVEPTPPPRHCTLAQDGWDSVTPRTLRSAAGRAYATIFHADQLTLTIDGAATLEFVGHGLRLRARPRASDLPVYARADLLFADVLHAGPATTLAWTPVDGPRLRVAPPKDRRVRFVHDPAVEVGCDNLILVPGVGDVVTPDHQLTARGPVAVSTTPGGPPVLHLRLPHGAAVKQLERAGSHARIAWPIDAGPLADATVTGWIDASLLGPLTTSTGSGIMGSALGFIGTSHWSGCGSDHPIHVDSGRGPELVGTILAGTRVRARQRHGQYVVVDVIGQASRSDPPPVKLVPGARFLLRPAAARECSR